MSKDIIKSAFIFVAGAAVGASATYIYARKKIQEANSRADADIESAKAVYTKAYEEQKAKAAQAKEKPDLSTYTDILNKYKEALIPMKKTEDEEVVENNIFDKEEVPYLITAEDFAHNEAGYAQIDLFYFSDGIIADDILQELSNPADYLGEYYHEILANNDDDALYFRNPKMEMDIAVAKDLRSFTEAQNEDQY